MAKILVVEDHPEMQELYEDILGEEHELLMVSDIPEAKKILDGNGIELIILDVLLPMKDGHFFLTEIRKRGDYENTPVILSTVLSKGNESVRIAMSFGNVFYVKKPFTPKQIRKIVRNKLNV